VLSGVESPTSNKEKNSLLQFMVLIDLNPQIDLNYVDTTANSVQFDLEKLRGDRSFKNAINRSIRYRNVSIEFMKQQKEMANDLLIFLNEELDESK